LFFSAALFASIVCLVPASTWGAAAAEPTDQPGPASGVHAAGVQKVDYDAAAGRLGVEATDADLGELLGTIAQKSAVPIELGAGIVKKVSVSFVGLPLEQGINSIVGAAGEGNLFAEYTKSPGDGTGSYRLEKIVLLRKGPGAAAAGATVGGEVSARENRGALGGLLREYQDPKTTRDEKLKMRRSIRRSAGTPEEKELLKRAVLDRRNRGQLAEDLQFALARSMREHPEKSDKAYILELLRRESSPGPLVRAMVGGGDPAYVQYLLSAARAQDLRAIELIGNLRIAQAVPVLRQLAAAPGNESPARQAAATALQRLGAAPAGRAGSVRVHE